MYLSMHGTIDVEYNIRKLSIMPPVYIYSTSIVHIIFYESNVIYTWP